MVFQEVLKMISGGELHWGAKALELRPYRLFGWFLLEFISSSEQVVQVQWPANDARTHHLKKFSIPRMVILSILEWLMGLGEKAWCNGRNLERSIFP